MRLRTLDLLRGVAALLVVIHHVPPYWNEHLGPLAPLLELFQRGGWLGVDLFFILSGYLVSGLLFGEFRQGGTVRPFRFLGRRAFKIYPPFLFLLACTAYLNRSQFEFGRFFAELFFVQNYLPGYWGHTWSLAIEEHFYLTLSLLVTALAGRGGANPFRDFPKIVAVVVALCLGARLYTQFTLPYSHLTHYMPTHLRIDSLFLGAWLSYRRHFHGGTPFALSARVRVWAGVLIALPPFFFARETHPWLVSVGYLGLSLGFCSLLTGALELNEFTSPVSRGVAALGRHSYSIYLWHLPVLIWVLPVLERWGGAPFPAPLRLMIYLGATAALGVGLGNLIEIPFLRWRDRLLPPPRAKLASPTTNLRKAG